MRQLRSRLRALMNAIESEAERNPEFATALAQALGIGASKEAPSSRPSTRKTRRRNKGVFDPMDVLRDEGVNGLRGQLASLDIEQLKDIVAENGMDQRKLAMKWKTADRLIDLIVTTAQSRVVRGDVFR
jgi:hypothetical protein